MNPLTESQLPPDDALSAILALATKKHSGSRFAFRAHDSELQDIFRDLAAQYSWLPKVFVFSVSGPRTFSPDLNESIAKLQLAGLLGRENPDYQIIFLRPSAASYFDKVLAPKLTDQMMKDLDAVAEAFVRKITFVS